MSVAAFSYLIRTTYRNRSRTRLRRLREPRYLIGLVLGVLYIYFFLFKYTAHADSPTASMLGPAGHVLAVAGIFLMTLSAWVFAGDKYALAFTPAEVAFLFPAPLSRRSLVAYKLFRAQIAILFNTFIWVLLLRRSGPLPIPLRALALWMLFTTLNFHRLGAALVRASLGAHRGHGIRRHRISVIVFASMVAAIAITIALHYPEIRAATNFRGAIRAIGDALADKPASIVLWPFAAVLAPTFAADPGSWLGAVPAALFVLAMHVWWVLRTDAAFEEAAAAASAERAEMVKEWRESRGWRRRKPSVTASPIGIRLAHTGHPAVAIIWKNFICLRRTLKIPDLFPLLFPSIMIGVVAGFDFEARSYNFAQGVTATAASVAVLMLLFGARIVRNDLRHDMLHIVALKTLPLRGHTIVAAEVLSAAIPVAIIQLACLAVAGVASQFMTEPIVGALESIAIFVGAIPTLIAYNIASVTVQNAAPVLFPAWTKLGASINPGLETLGQNLVSLGLVLVLLLIMLVVPVGIGAGVWFYFRVFAGFAVFMGLVAGSALLAVESYGAVRLFGRAFEKTEPSQL